MTQTQTKKFEKKERVVWGKRRRLCGGKGEGCKKEKEKVVWGKRKCKMRVVMVGVNTNKDYEGL